MKIPVLLPNIFDHPFTYEVKKKLNIGQYVLVPFGKSTKIGVVWNHFEKEKFKKNFQTKKIKKILNVPKMNLNTIKFLNWFSDYNLVPKGMCLKLHLLNLSLVMLAEFVVLLFLVEILFISNFSNRLKIKGFWLVT